MSPRDNFKRPNICIMGVPGEEKEQEIGNLFGEIVKEKFFNLLKETDMQAQEARIITNKMDAKRPTPRYIIIKMSKIKDKERILEAAREMHSVTYKRIPIRLSADFSKETLQARREWQEIFKVKKSRDLQPRLLYPAKTSFRIKELPRQEKTKGVLHQEPLLYEMLKGLI